MSSKPSDYFVPKTPVPITLDKTTVYVYPSLSKEMNEAEKLYGFTLTKNALKAASALSFKSKFECLKQNCGASNTIDVFSQRFISHAKQYSTHQANIKVIAYYGSNGRVITDAMDPITGHLKPVDNQTATNRRPSNIKYAKIQSMISFAGVDISCAAQVPFSYFIDLGDIETRTVQNSRGDDVDLTTSFVRDDWAHSNQANFQVVLRRPGAVGQPCTLNPPMIEADSHSEVTVDTSKLEIKLEELSLEAAWEVICKTVLKQICPTVIHDPATTLTNVRQTSTDKNGETVTMEVAEYYNNIMAFTDFFPNTGNWPIDVVSHFITHLDQDIRLQTQKDFRYNPTTASMDAFSQTQNLLLALEHASKAEKQKDQLSQTIKLHLQGTQVMNTSVHHSTAEATIRKYISEPVPDKPVKQCWGCGSADHVFAVKDNIVCPNKNMPGVMEKAAAVREDFRVKRKARKKRKSEDKKDKSDKRVATVADVKALILEHSPSKQSQGVFCLATEVKSPKVDSNQNLALAFKSAMNDIDTVNAQVQTETDPAESLISVFDDLAVTENDSKVLACNTVSVFVGKNPIKPPLPIQFDINIPHLHFDVGREEGKTFSISLAYDTAAQLNVGYAGYHLTIAKEFPGVVKELVWAKDGAYSPIALSGIVKDEDEKKNMDAAVTTLLPAVIEYYTPYTTKDGTPITVRIALGNDVSVNTILGVSTIKAAGISLDLDAKVFQVGILAGKPFDAIFKATVRGVPDVSPIKSIHPCAADLIKPSQVTPTDVLNCYRDVFASEVDIKVAALAADSAQDKSAKGDSTAATEEKSTFPFY